MNEVMVGFIIFVGPAATIPMIEQNNKIKAPDQKCSK
jgi:hypothetical protein